MADLVRRSALAFAAGFGVHAFDHLQRGFGASPMGVMAIGMAQGALVAAALLLALRGHRLAPAAAVAIGLLSVVLVVVGHLVPAEPSTFTDSFVTPAPGAKVTGFSWSTAFAEIATAVLFAAAGARVIRGRWAADAASPSGAAGNL